jgi:cytochrome P450
MSILHDLWSAVLHEGEQLKTGFENLREKLDLHLEHLLASPGKARAVFAGLRRLKPIFLAPHLAVVSLYEDVLEVLDHDEAFGVSQIYLAKMQHTTGDFVLGLDNNPQYQMERGLMRQAASRGDLETIRNSVSQLAEAIVADAGPRGRMDVIGELTRVVPMRLCGFYFGTPGEDEPTMMRWMRSIFREIFLNLGNDPLMRTQAEQDARALNAYLDKTIAGRKASIAAGKPAIDDFLGRLLRLQSTAAEPFDDTVIRRILGGTIVGTVDTNSKAIAQAIDVLLDRPAELAAARQAALENNDALFSRYIFEALRFNPQNPLLLRHCDKEYTVAANTARATTIPKGSRVVVGTESAMFDPAAFPEPEAFKVDRPEDKYLHFGHGLHSCFGGLIATIVIPVTAKALLRLPGLRRAPGSDGRLAYDGAFPNRLFVEFEH